MGTEGIDYDEYNIMDIITMKDGKYNSKDMVDNGIYPFYNASVNNPVGYINTCCFEENEYILFVKSGGNSNNKVSDTHALGLPILVRGKSSSNVHVSQILIKNTNLLSYSYLYYYLRVLKPKIQENAKYSTGLGGVDMDYFRSRNIRILKPNLISQYKLDDDFVFMDKLRNDISNTLKLQEITTKQMMSLILDLSQIGSEQDNSNKANIDSIAEKMGLEPIPDYDQLITDCNTEINKGKKLLKYLNILDQIIDSDNEVPDNGVSDFDLIDKVAKSKHSKKKTNQMIANI
jgi:hypothetical protein